MVPAGVGKRQHTIADQGDEHDDQQKRPERHHGKNNRSDGNRSNAQRSRVFGTLFLGLVCRHSGHH